jgi:glycosyltransferase involved in cell wall biosynthesis
MRLLIITQKVDINDDNLGFFHRWIEKFSEKLDKVYVICLAQGTYDLPEKVVVYSLGKEKGIPKIGQLIRLQKKLIQILPEVDGIFVHMCPIYALASFPLAKIFRKKMILWYLHRAVKWKLKLAKKCVDKILTASKESCRLKNRKKIAIVGHGIDIEKFQITNSKSQTNSKFQILSVGRISPIKDQETLIEAVDILVNQKNVKDLEVKFIGTPLEKQDQAYFKRLKNLISQKKLQDYIKFLGGISYNEMPRYYQNSDLVVNLSHTGSIDKTVLEAMACGCLVLTCNEAFLNILDNKYLFKKKDPQDLAKKILNLRSAEKDKNLREIVIKYHNLDNLIDKIIKFYE